jgi:hypothetical protein
VSSLRCVIALKKIDMIYLLTATELSPGGSTHLHTNNTQNNTNNNRTTQIITTEQHKYKLMNVNVMNKSAVITRKTR